MLAWDRNARLHPVALQDPEADTLLAGMPEEKRMASWHLAQDGGEVRSGGAAFGPLLRGLPGGRVLARLAEAAPGLTDRAYRLVAGNRSKLGPRIPDTWKARADRKIEARRDRTANP